MHKNKWHFTNKKVPFILFTFFSYCPNCPCLQVSLCLIVGVLVRQGCADCLLVLHLSHLKDSLCHRSFAKVVLASSYPLAFNLCKLLLFSLVLRHLIECVSLVPPLFSLFAFVFWKDVLLKQTTQGWWIRTMYRTSLNKMLNYNYFFKLWTCNKDHIAFIAQEHWKP